MHRRTLMFIFAVLCLALLVPGIASAQDVIPGAGEVAPQPEGNILTGISVEQGYISFVVNALAYAINYAAPWKSAQAKGGFVLIANIVIAAIYQEAVSGTFGWNTQTAVVIFQAVLTALIAAITMFAISTNPPLACADFHGAA